MNGPTRLMGRSPWWRQRKRITVDGEHTIDWLTVKGERQQTSYDWEKKSPTTCHAIEGGAILLSKLLEAAADKGTTIIDGPDLPSKPTLEEPQFHHTYASIEMLKHPQSENEVWAEKDFLGFTKAKKNVRTQRSCSKADLLVLDDEGLGFREDDKLWPGGLGPDYKNFIVLKMAGPLAAGDLWHHLYENFSDRLIVVADVRDMRHGSMEVSKGLSWERTARDLAGELIHKTSVNALSHCAYVIIHFGPVGAFLLVHPEIDSGDWMPRFRLLFDPEKMEGDWDTHAGRVWGHTSVLTAAIALGLIDLPKEAEGAAVEDAILHSVQRGLLAMRKLDLSGYKVTLYGENNEATASFPFDAVASTLRNHEPNPELDPFIVTPVPPPVLPRQAFFASPEIRLSSDSWTILKQQYRPEQLGTVAADIVREGAAATLRKAPLGQFGSLLTVDRQEIEGFRSIRLIASEYSRREETVKRPLSIAVFGSPGTGKSYSVMQVLNPVEGSQRSALGGEIKKLEFNLSQFASPDKLVDAFHRIRDVALTREIPVVFWDEFDTSLGGQELGWLRYFLSPMQDGTFREGDAVHPIGRCVFVFAGGRSHRFEEFRNTLGDDKRFQAVKGPDFLSRMRGFINIIGPNRDVAADGEKLKRDPYFVLRRAITFRSLLWMRQPDLFHWPKRFNRSIKPDRKERDKGLQVDVDSGVLNAFLNISRYEHGVRSMEAIIEMSTLSGRPGFERSCLPSIGQLDLHVDGVEFLKLMRNLDVPILESTKSDDSSVKKAFWAELQRRAAAEAMVVEPEYRNDAFKFGGAAGNVPSESETDDLNDFIGDIPNLLGDAGYRIAPVPVKQEVYELPHSVKSGIAKEAHRLWRRRKTTAGWKYGTVTDRDRKVHQALLPWGQLPESLREFEMLKVAAIRVALMENKLAVDRFERDPE